MGCLYICGLASLFEYCSTSLEQSLKVSIAVSISSSSIIGWLVWLLGEVAYIGVWGRSVGVLRLCVLCAGRWIFCLAGSWAFPSEQH